MLGPEKLINPNFDGTADPWQLFNMEYGDHDVVRASGTAEGSIEVPDGIDLTSGGNGGSGYTEGDIVTLSNGNADCQVQLHSLLPGGTVQPGGWTMLTAGSGYSAQTLSPTTGGTGTGLIFFVDFLEIVQAHQFCDGPIYTNRRYRVQIYVGGTQGTVSLQITTNGEVGVFEQNIPAGAKLVSFVFTSPTSDNEGAGFTAITDSTFDGFFALTSFREVIGDLSFTTSFLSFADFDGDVQVLNSGSTDNGSPIPYELETQELDLGNRMHLKKISDKVVVFARNAGDSEFSAIQSNGERKAIPVDLSGRVNIGEDVNLEGTFFVFRWAGESSGVSVPVFEGLMLPSVTDFGMTYG